jgi:hypothetical protein
MVAGSLQVAREGTRSAFVQPVNFYEVLADGYHSPLTKTQITELFHAGRLHRNHRCKQLSQKEWRTIDELFPLLKYQSAGPASYYSPETEARSGRTWILIFALLVAAIAATGFWHYFASDAERTDRPKVAAHDWPKTIPATSSFVSTAPREKQTPNIATTVPMTAYAPPTTTIEAANEIAYIAPRIIDPQQTQLAEQRRQDEQREREQNERARVMAERANTGRTPAAQDVIIPLDRDTVITFGGISVRVKIHDNDVTSFDVWINGVWRREVPKQKGITNSGSDETPLYGSGGAHLYYVWEISGKLNHCRLRVRED